mmetsp:Transcript_59516/g.72851  ORF Transcript_59516/g.72851 Transcript_59516/m.72851 type:complete len:146 (+) Transcript_59516:40-477(+)
MSMQGVMLVPITFGIVLVVFAFIAVIVLIIRGHNRGRTEESGKAVGIAVGIEADIEASVQEIFLRDEETTCTICLEAIKRGEPARQMYCNHAFHSKCLVEMCRRQCRQSLECPICRHKQPIKVQGEPIWSTRRPSQQLDHAITEM